MVLCDRLLRDASTGKFTLVDVFTHMLASQLPAALPSLFLYFCFSEAAGSYWMNLQLRDRATGQNLLPGSEALEMRVPGPNYVVEESLQMVNLLFPHPGQFDLVLTANDRDLGSRTIWVGEGVRPDKPGAPPQVHHTPRRGPQG